MKKNKKTIITISALVGIVLLLIATAYAVTAPVDENVKDVQAKSVLCDITVEDPVIGGPGIEMVDCRVTTPCRNNLFSLASVWVNVGELTLSAPDDQANKLFTTVSVGGREDATLQICTRYYQQSGSINVRYINKDTNEIQVEPVVLG